MVDRYQNIEASAAEEHRTAGSAERQGDASAAEEQHHAGAAGERSFLREQFDRVFAEEQAHLMRTYEKLLELRERLRRKLEQTDAQAAEDKLSMVEDVTQNFATFDDTLETLVAYEAVNRVIDGYNISQDTSARKLVDIELLLKQPYFAKVVLRYSPNEEPRELYIGVVGIADEMCKRMVVDWRSPVAEVFYNQENGRTSYKANGRTIDVDLLLRRQFDIEEGVLKEYFDTTVAIQDPMLLSSLAARRTDKLQAITTTIQKEQNLVVRHEDVPVLLVSGVAGSGKTSVMLQRIAYLFYQLRETLDPKQVFLITPNPVFSRYIEDVLPDMGESNPVSFTWEEFLMPLLPEGRHAGNLEVPIDVFERIDESVPNVQLSSGDFSEIRAHGHTLISVGQIEQILRKHSNASMGPHRITLVREELLERLERKLAGDRFFEEMRDELEDLSIEEQIKMFGAPLDLMEDDAQGDLRDHISKMIAERYSNAVRAVEDDEWLRIDRIGMRMLGVKSLGPMEWLYVKMALTGMCNADAKYVFIDEAQDYALSQLYVLATYFRRAHFILLGDENQSITPGTASFNEIAELFKKKLGSIDRCDLNISYRSTPAITELFAKLASGGMDISSVQRSDVPPEIYQCESEGEYAEKLCQVVKAAESANEGASESESDNEGASEEAGLTAIIVPWKSELKRISKILGESAPQEIDDAGSLPESGMVMMTLKLAKGLEFDRVIIPDASARLFPNDDISRRRLYTAISRATKRICILSDGRITKLLER